MTGYSWSTPAVVATLEVNGPEDLSSGRDLIDWETIDWRSCEQQVRRLRQRIFKATQEQDWAKVRNLQRLMLRSRANTLVSVRQVAQRNAGRKTAGIDGEVALTSPDRAELAVRVHRSIRTWRPEAVKRVSPRPVTRPSCAHSAFPCSWTGATRRLVAGDYDIYLQRSIEFIDTPRPASRGGWTIGGLPDGLVTCLREATQ